MLIFDFFLPAECKLLSSSYQDNSISTYIQTQASTAHQKEQGLLTLLISRITEK